MDSNSIHFKTYKNLQTVSVIFFLVLGLIHFISGMLFYNGFYKNVTFIINNTFDIPFIISALSYLFSSIKVFLMRHDYESKTLDTAMLGLIIFVFVSLIYFNLFTPDASL